MLYPGVSAWVQTVGQIERCFSVAAAPQLLSNLAVSNYVPIALTCRPSNIRFPGAAEETIRMLHCLFWQRHTPVVFPPRHQESQKHLQSSRRPSCPRKDLTLYNHGFGCLTADPQKGKHQGSSVMHDVSRSFRSWKNTCGGCVPPPTH